MKVINVHSLGEMCESLLEGEPVFIIRAQDQAALAALRTYLDLSNDCGGTNLTRVGREIERFRAWQEANPKRVKAAD